MMKLYGNSECNECRAVSDLMQFKNIPHQWVEVEPSDELPQLDDHGRLIIGYYDVVNYINMLQYELV